MRGFDVRLLLLHTAVCLVLTSSACAAHQAKPPLPFAEHRFLNQPVQLSLRQKSLPDIIECLSTVAHINVVTDGLTGKTAANIEVKATVREALDQIASAFDCGWSVSKSGIVMFARRFNDPAEFPQIHFREMLQMVREIHSALQIVPPDVLKWAYTPRINQLVYSLTPEQRAAAENDKLTGRDLFPEQLAWLNTAILNHEFANSIVSFEMVLPFMEGMPTSTLQMKPPSMPLPGVVPTNPEALSTEDCLYTIRDKSGTRRTYFLVNKSIVTTGTGR